MQFVPSLPLAAELLGCCFSIAVSYDTWIGEQHEYELGSVTRAKPKAAKRAMQLMLFFARLLLLQCSSARKAWGQHAVPRQVKQWRLSLLHQLRISLLHH
jgi:hypothetical protein